LAAPTHHRHAGASGRNGDPDFNQKIADRWSVLRTNVLNAANVLQRIDELAALLSEAAGRDFAKYPYLGAPTRLGTYWWPNPNGPPYWHVDFVHPTNYPGVIAEMKSWVLGRYLWIDGQFTPAPTFNHPGGEITPGFSLSINGPASATIYYTLDGTDPRVSAGGVSPSASIYNGPIQLGANARVVARARGSNNWFDTWSGPATLGLFVDLPPLRITEIMFHPSDSGPGLNDGDRFEFIEVKNIGRADLNLGGFRLRGAVVFDFPGLTLMAEQSAVVVRDLAAFQSRYGASLPNILVAGTYSGDLPNGGGRTILEGPLGEPIHDFTYSAQWHPTTAGLGFSLVTWEESAPLNNWGLRTGWRPSTASDGSPGQTDPHPPLPPRVVVNEALSFGDPAMPEFIELHNPTGETADLSGWFLTDEFTTPHKFVIPLGTELPAGGYVTFAEAEYNSGPNAFFLNADGGTVFLFSGNGAELTGYAHGFQFGPAAQGVSFGRHVLGSGEEDFVAQTALTPGAANSGAAIGPVIVSEIMYRPIVNVVGGVGLDNTGDEYIELQNPGGVTVPLHDPNVPDDTWRLTGALDYAFPFGATLPPGGFLIVVGFDPVNNPGALAAFRARNLVSAAVPIFGPWRGHLDNNGGRVELRRPDSPRLHEADTGGLPFVPYLLVEQVEYSRSAPWPTNANGSGLSLHRVTPMGYGNDPVNWAAAAPTPGAAYVGGAPPTILSQPGDVLLLTARAASLSVSATGTLPLRYQWRFNGLPLPAATNATLVLTNVQPLHAGVYNILVYNSGGSALGTNFTVTTRVGLQFTIPPTNTYVRQGSNATFTVAALGTGAVHYQWRFNGANLPNATAATLTVSNVQPADEGSYTVEIRDDLDTLESQPAILTLLLRPTFTLQPISQAAVEGSSVAFSAAASGNLPIGFRWRNQGVTLSNLTSGYVRSSPTSSVLVLTNVSLTVTGRYTVVASNLAGTFVSSNAVLTVLADSDGDGIPDMLEPSNGAADDDGDGLSNAAEYLAGPTR
jgi:hypothetical protein